MTQVLKFLTSTWETQEYASGSYISPSQGLVAWGMKLQMRALWALYWVVTNSMHSLLRLSMINSVSI